MNTPAPGAVLAPCTRDYSSLPRTPSRPPNVSPWSSYPLAGTGADDQVSLRVYRNLLSPQLRNYRDLLVAMPPGHAASGRRYPVLYLQDGQNLFDPATSFAGDWGLIGTMASLAAGGLEVICVGIPNMGPRRRYEYGPFRDRMHGGGGGDRYLAFVTETVKPLVDASFPTLPGREATVIGGSSLGGLISLYGLYRYPEVFAAAAALSPALWFAEGAFLRYVGGERPRDVPGRIYLDIGMEEGDEAVADVRALRAALRDAGAREGEALSYREDPGAAHEEGAWGRRLHDAIPFLFGRPAPVRAGETRPDPEPPDAP